VFLESGNFSIGVIEMEKQLPIQIPHKEIAEFCQRNYIHKLSLFGSVLREDFNPNSDVDMLVEFDPDHVPWLYLSCGYGN
jgi:predicted nucleotidyltransferase